MHILHLVERQHRSPESFARMACRTDVQILRHLVLQVFSRNSYNVRLSPVSPCSFSDAHTGLGCTMIWDFLARGPDITFRSYLEWHRSMHIVQTSSGCPTHFSPHELGQDGFGTWGPKRGGRSERLQKGKAFDATGISLITCNTTSETGSPARLEPNLRGYIMQCGKTSRCQSVALTAAKYVKSTCDTICSHLWCREKSEMPSKSEIRHADMRDGKTWRCQACALTAPQNLNQHSIQLLHTCDAKKSP